LAEQAATGSYSAAQREIMNAEFVEMAAEIERSANSTEFNDINMLNTSSGSVAIHVGTAETIDVDKVNMTKSGLDIETGEGEWTATTAQATGVVAADSGIWFNTGATAASFTLDFDEVGFANGGEIAFSFAAGTYTLDEVAAVINAASENPATMYDGDGNRLGYQAAEVVQLADRTYGLKLKSRTSDAAAMSFLTGGATHSLMAGGFGTPATVLANDYNLLADTSIDVFEYWNTSTSSWAHDTTGQEGGGLNILTVEGATSALAKLDTAINAKDSARAAFGYKMNRLESTIAVLNIQSENLGTAESRISDVDVATEMANLTKAQVLSQAGVAMLAQANAMPQMALTLLRG
ncbi:MAG TPA: flagellin, partial [Sedimentisphaerales bacterium]|nr:flagellin [Sedimentisphaerales bacterium]